MCSLGVPGLGLTSDWLSPDEEASLLSLIDQGPWSNALRRRVQHHGYRYDYTRRNLAQAEAEGAPPARL